MEIKSIQELSQIERRRNKQRLNHLPKVRDNGKNKKLKEFIKKKYNPQ